MTFLAALVEFIYQILRSKRRTDYTCTVQQYFVVRLVQHGVERSFVEWKLCVIMINYTSKR